MTASVEVFHRFDEDNGHESIRIDMRIVVLCRQQDAWFVIRRELVEAVLSFRGDGYQTKKLINSDHVDSVQDTLGPYIGPIVVSDILDKACLKAAKQLNVRVD